MAWWRRRRPDLSDVLRPRLVGLHGDLAEHLGEVLGQYETDRLVGFLGLLDELAELDPPDQPFGPIGA